jgi:hypothetical protein
MSFSREQNKLGDEEDRLNDVKFFEREIQANNERIKDLLLGKNCNCFLLNSKQLSSKCKLNE